MKMTSAWHPLGATRSPGPEFKHELHQSARQQAGAEIRNHRRRQARERRTSRNVPTQRVAFGTSGHRSSAIDVSFNDWHILAITQAACDYCQGQDIYGPLFLGIDTHALSAPACASALEVPKAPPCRPSRPAIPACLARPTWPSV
ncbi:MAG: hypothetical protein ACI8UD_000963 [Planctomycetota bacterium]|jgi:hypothetical protein